MESERGLFVCGVGWLSLFFQRVVGCCVAWL